MRSDATTVDEYLDELPEDRRRSLRAVRDVILANLPEGYEEAMAYGMIGYSVPLERFPDTYNGQPLSYVALANQKRHMALYLMGVYGDAEADFRTRVEATGMRLDMGKSCVRFRTAEDLPLAVIGEEVARLPVEAFLRQYADARTSSRRR